MMGKRNINLRKQPTADLQRTLMTLTHVLPSQSQFALIDSHFLC